MEYTIRHVQSIDSTNTALKALAKSGAPEGTVLVADTQTGGRGRLGRSFFSPAGSGLYVSILLRPSFIVSPASLTCLSAVAAADTVFSFGKSCTIKWVNDIYCGQKKAGGILVEGALTGSGLFEYAVVGIGINLSLPDEMPEELKPVITGIFPAPTDLAFRDRFLDALLSSFRSYYEKLPAVTFRDRYVSLQNVFGRQVSFWEQGQEMTGTAESIDEQFRLLIRSGERLVALERGEVTFL